MVTKKPNEPKICEKCATKKEENQQRQAEAKDRLLNRAQQCWQKERER